MSKHRGSGLLGPDEEEMIRYDAQRHVERAFMETPQAKALVTTAIAEIKAAKVAMKKTLATGLSPKRSPAAQRKRSRRNGPPRINVSTFPFRRKTA